MSPAETRTPSTTNRALALRILLKRRGSVPFGPAATQAEVARGRWMILVVQNENEREPKPPAASRCLIPSGQELIMPTFRIGCTAGIIITALCAGASPAQQVPSTQMPARDRLPPPRTGTSVVKGH